MWTDQPDEFIDQPWSRDDAYEPDFDAINNERQMNDEPDWDAVANELGMDDGPEANSDNTGYTDLF